jgi:hypothetical protein
MPWGIRKDPKRAGCWQVYNRETRQVKAGSGKCMTREDCHKQIALLERVEHERGK